ncbi:hypothetical protein FT641_19335 [Bacillus paranthracis]|uniref:hypothetical protein n=1 Tax=Bacillus paranthracis TaxID=2026186 RepID=UPI00187987CB|nr:hypothetical protein [Bacillus paranthracis]MBE7114281.1 hypothetical protein [Bacillus paranthracis]MBE7154846.1 hypothetical protein [Bacillus paranthracis]
MGVRVTKGMKEMFDLQKRTEDELLVCSEVGRSEVFDERVMGLLEDIGECMDNWQGHKYYQMTQEPITAVKSTEVCENCGGTGYEDEKPENGVCQNSDCKGGQVYENPLLMAYIKGLWQCIGLCQDFGVSPNYVGVIKATDVKEQFFDVYEWVLKARRDPSKETMDYLLAVYMGLGDMLGFDFDLIVREFLDKTE